jgi:hypothetical protein
MDKTSPKKSRSNSRETRRSRSNSRESDHPRKSRSNSRETRRSRSNSREKPRSEGLSLPIHRTIIGRGNSGVVIYPCIGCSEETLFNNIKYVSKIMLQSKGIEEITAYNKLPDELNSILYYKFCELCQIVSVDLVSSFNKKITDANKDKYCIINSTYVSGVQLTQFLNLYKSSDNEECGENEDKPIMSIKILYKLFISLKKFNYNLNQLNLLEYYHNDISSTNIMLVDNLDEFDLILIDFEHSNSTPQYGIVHWDMSRLTQLINELFYNVLYIPSLSEHIQPLYEMILFGKIKVDNYYLFNQEILNYIIYLINPSTDIPFTPLDTILFKFKK